MLGIFEVDTMDEVHKVAPKAYPVIPTVAPALGAYYMGLDEIENGKEDKLY